MTPPRHRTFIGALAAGAVTVAGVGIAVSYDPRTGGDPAKARVEASYERAYEESSRATPDPVPTVDPTQPFRAMPTGFIDPDQVFRGQYWLLESWQERVAPDAVRNVAVAVDWNTDSRAFIVSEIWSMSEGRDFESATEIPNPSGAPSIAAVNGRSVVIEMADGQRFAYDIDTQTIELRDA